MSTGAVAILIYKLLILVFSLMFPGLFWVVSVCRVGFEGSLDAYRKDERNDEDYQVLITREVN